MEVGVVGKIPSYRWEVDTTTFKDKKTGESLLSPVFSYHNSDGFKHSWQLILFPKGENNKNQGFYSIFLKSNNKNKTTARYYISLLDQNNVKTKEMGYLSTFAFGKDRGWGRFVEESYVHDAKNNLLKDNKMTIWCCVLIEEIDDTREVMNADNLRKLDHLKKFETLLSSEEFSDVTVIAEDGRSFKLHKLILALNSSVFKAMFSTDMKEKNKNLVNIKDIRYEVLQELFRFIYYGEVYNFNEIAGELFMAAEKYCIDKLVELCENTMCNQLTKENAVEYLNLALLYNVNKLKKKAMKCIALHVQELITDRVFENLALQHPKVYHKIMLEFFAANPVPNGL